MITPKFSVTQNEEYLFITIHILHFRAQSVEIDVTGKDFKFFANPYYLRLKFPGEVEENEDSDAKLNASEGKLSIKLSKVNKGEFFPDLDLTSVLLATRTQSKAIKKSKPLIQELGGELLQLADSDSEQETDWELPQQIEEDFVLGSKYGFNSQYSGWFVHVDQTPNEINEIRSPESANNIERTSQQIELENELFNEDYYMSNYIDDDEILTLLKFENEFQKQYNRLNKSISESTINSQVCANASDPEFQEDQYIETKQEKIEFFSEKEKTIMLGLPKKSYLVDNKKAIYLGLVDIVFAYLYNHRITEGENNVESSWVIGKLSACCSGLREFSTLRECLTSCYRRSLVYPLYRNWDLSEQVKRDTSMVFGLGKRYLLKILLDLKDIFDHSDVYYVYSKILIDDYCIWIQNSAKDSTLQSLSEKIQKLVIEKNDVDLNLEEYEDLALATSESELSGEEELNEHSLSQLNINSEKGKNENVKRESSEGSSSILLPGQSAEGSKKKLLIELLDDSI